MKSHAALLAEIEEKRLENNNLRTEPQDISIIEPDLGGYDPYDNPGHSKKLPDGVDVTAIHRSTTRRTR